MMFFIENPQNTVSSRRWEHREHVPRHFWVRPFGLPRIFQLIKPHSSFQSRASERRRNAPQADVVIAELNQSLAFVRRREKELWCPALQQIV